MKILREWLRRFAGDARGATAIEYGLIATGIFLAIVAPVGLMGDNTAITYNDIANYFSDIL